MKTVTCFRELEQFGIMPLTGEACSLSFRLLCDVTKEGAAIFRKCFGLPRDSKLGEAWNRGTEDDPHVGSVMLSLDALIPLGIFGLLDGGCIEVHQIEGVLIGIEPNDPPDSVETMRRVYRVESTRRYGYGPHGDRNQHQMSGRVE